MRAADDVEFLEQLPSCRQTTPPSGNARPQAKRTLFIHHCIFGGGEAGMLTVLLDVLLEMPDGLIVAHVRMLSRLQGKGGKMNPEHSSGVCRPKLPCQHAHSKARRGRVRQSKLVVAHTSSGSMKKTSPSKTLPSIFGQMQYARPGGSAKNFSRIRAFAPPPPVGRLVALQPCSSVACLHPSTTQDGVKQESSTEPGFVSLANLMMTAACHQSDPPRASEAGGCSLTRASSLCV